MGLGNKRRELYFSHVLKSCISERLLENERFHFPLITSRVTLMTAYVGSLPYFSMQGLTLEPSGPNRINFFPLERQCNLGECWPGFISKNHVARHYKFSNLGFLKWKNYSFLFFVMIALKSILYAFLFLGVFTIGFLIWEWVQYFGDYKDNRAK